MTTQTIIDLLGNLDKAEILFDKILLIKGTSIEISGIGVDGNDRLWMKTSRHNWVELHDRLIYHTPIIQALYNRLQCLNVVCNFLNEKVK